MNMYFIWLGNYQGQYRVLYSLKINYLKNIRSKLWRFWTQLVLIWNYMIAVDWAVIALNGFVLRIVEWFFDVEP